MLEIVNLCYRFEELKKDVIVGVAGGAAAPATEGLLASCKSSTVECSPPLTGLSIKLGSSVFHMLSL